MIPAVRSGNENRILSLVVKIGGSLYHQVPRLMPVLNGSERPLLIIPGGGPFADTVRQCNVNNETAHWMAVAAMEQFGWYLSTFGMDTTQTMTAPVKTAVFLPYQCLRLTDVLPHSWNTTSDTIAAWVAGTLGLDLVLLKSVDGIFTDGVLCKQVAEPVDSDVVDPFFIPFVLRNSIKTAIINGTYPERVENFLNGQSVPGTEIGTTF